MAGEEQYYNPIVQAMIHSRQLQMEGSKLEFDKEKAKQEQEARKIQLQQQLKQIEYEHEHQTALTGLQSEMQNLHHEVARINAVKDVNKAATEGVNVQNIIDKFPLLKGMKSTDFATPQAEVQRIKDLAQAQSSGAAQGALPAQKELAAGKQQNEIELKGIEHKQKLEELVAQGANLEHIAKIHGDYANANANITGAYHLKGIALMHQLGMDDGSGQQANIAKQLTDGVFNGSFDYSKLTPDQKRAVTAYASANGEESSIPTDQKGYVKKLDTVSGLQTLITQFRELAQTYSRDASGAFGKGNQNLTVPIVGTLQRTQPGSEMESKLNTVKAMGGQLASFFDQQNRKSDAEIIRQVTGLFDPKSTVEQNLKKVNDHVTQLQQVVRNNFVGMIPERINKILGDRGIGDFGAFGDKKYKHEAVNPANNHKIGSDDGVKWFDVKTGNEVSK